MPGRTRRRRVETDRLTCWDPWTKRAPVSIAGYPSVATARRCRHRHRRPHPPHSMRTPNSLAPLASNPHFISLPMPPMFIPGGDGKNEKMRAAHSRRVECVTFCILFASVIGIFARLRSQRSSLPHAMRANDFLAPPEKHAFHIVHFLVRPKGQCLKMPAH